MDAFTLTKLEFDQIRRILQRYCRCALGRELAGKIAPSRNPETVRQWLEQCSQMVRALRDYGPPPFAGVTDITAAVDRAAPGGGATGEDFAAIASTLAAAGAVRRWSAALGEALTLPRQMGQALAEFDETVEAIRAVVDSRGQILDHASTALAKTRREIEATRRRIHEIIYGYVKRSEIARILQNPTVTLHDDRFVLPVKAEFRHELPGVVHRASHTGATLFVEPSESVELNNHLVSLVDAERREIARLLNELAIVLGRRRDDILSALRTLAQIDLVAAKAEYAYEFDFACPQVSERGRLQLHGALHPLLIEQVYQHQKAAQAAGGAAGPAHRQRTPKPPDEVVPIDVRLGTDFDVLVITGPNTGGKTVTLKTVGLLAAMAQSGLHVPARRGSTLPVFRDVLIDVGDEQSLQQSLSTFGGHISQIRSILRQADRYCLVLLDELGAGTDPDEGGAIGQAILDELGRIGCLSMVTTHLSVLKAYAYSHERVDNASVEFDARTLRPTYHLRIGEPGESHAITVSAAIGLGKHVIAAARQHLGESSKAFRRAIAATSASRRASEQARSQAHAAQLAAESAQESYAAKLADLHQLQQSFENWLASLSEFRPGDEVPVPHMNKTGRLARIQFNKQIAVVDVDNVQVEVPLRELLPDLGQAGVRREIASLREQILAQARQAEAIRAEAEHLQSEYHRSLARARERQEQFDRWLAAVGAARVGQQVTIDRRPSKGVLLELNLPAGRAKVQTDKGQLELPIQELFPQVGSFAPPPKAAGHPPKPPAAKAKDRPLRRRKPDSRSAKADRDAVLKVEPGRQVYVLPFHKRATLIRFNHDKDEAVVQAGAFEMQVPIADLAPVRKNK